MINVAAVKVLLALSFVGKVSRTKFEIAFEAEISRTQPIEIQKYRVFKSLWRNGPKMANILSNEITTNDNREAAVVPKSINMIVLLVTKLTLFSISLLHQLQ